jgi:hypothetical protein
LQTQDPLDSLLESVLNFVEGLVVVMKIDRPLTNPEAEKMQELLESLDPLEQVVQDMRRFSLEKAIEVLALIEGKRNEIKAALESACLNN